jgi:RNA polymerase sigma factor (sigma-70 family)
LAVAVPDIHREIIERSKTGDASAQYELYRLYSKAMFNIACRMMSRREEAEDILQESFIDAFSHLNAFRYDSSFGSWLKRIVINHCLNEIKRRKTDLKFFDDMGYFDHAEGDEEIGIEAALSVANVRKAMEHLPNGSKVIFSLYLLEGYDHVEIAQILKITESNSKTQYMRAKQKVREILKQWSHETG